MLDLIKALRKKDDNRKINYDKVKDMSKSERIKTIKKYPIDVVHHLDALFWHCISEMKRNMSLGKYHIDHFFNRVEFQQRGSAHINCLLWLVTEQGWVPPNIYLKESEDEAVRESRHKRFVDYFNSLICASSTHEELSKERCYQDWRR